jgi:pectinesterase
MIVPLVPKIPNHHLQPLNGTYPAWLKLDDKTLLDSSVADIKGNANVVVAQDGSGNFKTLTEAVASVPDNSNARYVIYIKKGTYMENVVFGMTKKNVMLVGDGMDATLITGSWNQIDGKSILQSATVGNIIH